MLQCVRVCVCVCVCVCVGLYCATHYNTIRRAGSSTRLVRPVQRTFFTTAGLEISREKLRKHFRDKKTGISIELQMHIAASVLHFASISVCWLLTAAVRGLFSVLSLVKNEIGTTMSDERLVSHGC